MEYVGRRRGPAPGSGEINKKRLSLITQLIGFLADVAQDWADEARTVYCELEGFDASQARKQDSRVFEKVCYRESFPVKILHSKIETN